MQRKAELMWQDFKDHLNPNIIHTQTPEQFAKVIAKKSARRQMIPTLIDIGTTVRPLTEGFQMETYVGNKTIRYREDPPRRKRTKIIPANFGNPTDQAINTVETARITGVPLEDELALTLNSLGSFADETIGVGRRFASWVGENRIAILRALNTAIQREDQVREAIQNEFSLKGDPTPGIAVYYTPGFGDFITRRIHGRKDQVLREINKSQVPEAIAPWPLRYN